MFVATAYRLLLEEALSTISARSIEMTTSTGHQTYGLQRTDEFCGVAVGAEGFPFLVLFHQMEPDAPQGSIHIGLETRQQGQSDWRLEHVDLPSDITRYRILLFSSTVNTGGGECKAIEALCSLGVEESRITLVIILCSTDSLVTICGRFPGTQLGVTKEGREGPLISRASVMSCRCADYHECYRQQGRFSDTGDYPRHG